jgi:hypothetical protein
MVFKEIKRSINSLPDNIKFIVNGKQTDVTAVMIKQNSIEINLEYEVNVLDYLEHDGCEKCKYEFTYPDLDQEPCLSCRQNHMDNWERA